MNMNVFYVSLLIGICLVAIAHTKTFKEEDCEVCVKVIKKFEEFMPDRDNKITNEIETEFKKLCKTFAKDSKDERFCYYMGGTTDSATSTLKSLSEPFKSYLPPLKICEKIRKNNPQICDLKYEKQIDLMTVDFKKLKVKDLKKILADWGEEKACKGCSEKSEFIRAVKQLMPKYAPEAADKLKLEL